MEKYLNSHQICEICNTHKATQVHHKIPLSIGGIDDCYNYISLCDGCHHDEHNNNSMYSKSRLSQFALYKRRYDFGKDNNDKAKLVSIIDLYHILNIFFGEYKENLTVADVLDIIDALPSYGTVDENIVNSNYKNISNWLQQIHA